MKMIIFRSRKRIARAMSRSMRVAETKRMEETVRRAG